MKKETVIKLTNLTKVYKLHQQKPTLAENIFRGSSEKFVALNNLNLEIKKGEKVGIIGRNGSGKTTLLKVISGIATPTSGKIKTTGKLVSLIDLSAGFHPELTGAENVYLNALLVGMTRPEIKSSMEKIVDFAGIGKFIDQPLYTYSSGMQLRLGFSVAVAANPDILILDEGTAVGDEDFQKKSSRKIAEFFKQGKTIILVSHWLDYLRTHCKRVIWLESGSLKEDGGLSVIDHYEKSSN